MREAFCLDWYSMYDLDGSWKAWLETSSIQFLPSIFPTAICYGKVNFRQSMIYLDCRLCYCYGSTVTYLFDGTWSHQFLSWLRLASGRSTYTTRFLIPSLILTCQTCSLLLHWYRKSVSMSDTYVVKLDQYSLEICREYGCVLYPSVWYQFISKSQYLPKQ